MASVGKFTGDRAPAGLLKSSPLGLVILGMHRSGTSALAGILGKCGAWVGSDSDLTDPNIENPKGFFERRDIRAICDGLLHSAGADWWRVAKFEIEAIPPAAVAQQSRDFQRVVTELNSYGIWLIKEPRLCLLLPVLRSIIPNAACIHIYRNPLEVARSLQARNGFGIAEGLALWEFYSRAALRASAGLPRTLVSYEQLVACPESAIGALVSELKRQLDANLALPDIETMNGFISKDLHRQRSGFSDAEIFLSESQRDLWQRLESGEVLRTEERTGISEATRQHLRDLESRKIAVERICDRLKATEGRVSTLEAQLRSRNEQLKEQKAKFESTIALFQASFSWRITAPVRALSGRFQSAGANARHACKHSRDPVAKKVAPAAGALLLWFGRCMPARVRACVPDWARNRVAQWLHSLGSHKRAPED